MKQPLPDNIRLLVQQLLLTGEDPLATLQSIAKQLLTQYALKISDDFLLYPIEVEAYYHNEKSFPDLCVHRNEYQKNRFGQLYFHRHGRKAEGSFTYWGMDVCLSDGDYHLGILIRSARIETGGKIETVCGPGLLVQNIIRHICNGKDHKELTKNDIEKIKLLEQQYILVKTENKCRNNDIIFISPRWNINPKRHPDTCKYPLRLLIELKEHPFKGKEAVAMAYFNNLKHKNITKQQIKDILGYTPKYLLEYFNLS